MKFRLVFVFILFIAEICLHVANVEASSSVVGSIAVGGRPADIVSTPSGNKLYVSNSSGNSVSVIDTNSNSVIKTIPMTTGGETSSLAISPNGTEVYVAERLTGKIKVISTVSDTVVATISTDSSLLNGISVTPDGSKIYATSAVVRGTIRMTIIDIVTRTAVDYIDTVDAQDGIIFSPDGKTGYLQLVVNNSNPLNVYTQVIDLEPKVVKGIIHGSIAMSVSSDGWTAWGINYGESTANLIDLSTNTVTKNTAIAAIPLGLVMLSDINGDYIFVSNHSFGLVTKLDAQSLDIVETIPVTGLYPTEMVLSHDKSKLYVVSMDTNSVDIIQLDTTTNVNNPPTISIPELGGGTTLSVAEGNSISFTVQTNDPDGDAVTLSAEDVPSGALFNQSTGVFSWTPSSSTAGEHVVSFTATDTGVPALSSSIEVHITVTDVPVDEKDMYDLIRELIDAINAYEFSNEIENSYFANLKKVEKFFNSAMYIPAENQLRAFLKKLKQDYKAEKITEEEYTDLMNRADALLDVLSDDTFGMVPLMTQIASPYPSLVETTEWATTTYADGRADTVGDCGRSIAQCGCAITSLSMIGKYHGIEKGFDGTNVNPLNMNAWLIDNKGYSSDGSVLWNYALAYLGEEKNGKVMSKLSLDGHNEMNTNTIGTFIDNANPSLGFNATKGHYVVLTHTIDEGGFSIKDPLWYNTKTTDDERDVVGKVQDYNDVVSKANLIGYNSSLTPLPESVEIVLESPAELLVTDEKGRRLGYDVETNTFVSEIPGGSYDREDFILNQENPSANPHMKKRIYIRKPEGEKFAVQVIGTGVGEYHLSFAVTDGKGGLFGEQIASTTSVGKVDGYTVTTLSDTDALPSYLQDILKLIPQSEQKKFIQKFFVIAGQIEKNHVVSTEQIVDGLIRFIEEKYSEEEWTQGVINALETLVE